MRGIIKLVNKKDKKPLVGFFPLFQNLAETGRALMVAKRYIKIGGRAVFFSHGGQYEFLAKDLGFKIIRVKPIYTSKFYDNINKLIGFKLFKDPKNKFFIENIEEEISAYKKTGVKLIVSTNNFTCSISARAAGVPLISITPKINLHFTKFPDIIEYSLTRFLPESLKLRLLNWYAPRCKISISTFSKIAKKYKVNKIEREEDIFKGDYTFYTNFADFLGIDKSEISSDEYYVGLIFFDEIMAKYTKKQIEDKESQEHLKKPGRSILLTLGSSGTKDLFLKILNTLNKTQHNVLAVYTSILKDEELPVLRNNIMLKKFVPSIKDLYKFIDLSITHGGQGTVYTSAYAGKPIIGFPMQLEQHLNLERFMKHGMALIESGKYFKEEKLLKAINNIFDNYDFYLKNAQNVANALPKPDGAKNSGDIILKILDKEGSV